MLFLFNVGRFESSRPVWGTLSVGRSFLLQRQPRRTFNFQRPPYGSRRLETSNLELGGRHPSFACSRIYMSNKTIHGSSTTRSGAREKTRALYRRAKNGVLSPITRKKNVARRAISRPGREIKILHIPEIYFTSTNRPLNYFQKRML